MEGISKSETTEQLFNAQFVDMGIALSHYIIATGKNNIFVNQPDIEMPANISEYIISVKN